jgi:ribosomal protein S12 methylthiotransferase
MIGYYKEKGYEIVNNPEEAEILVINTCGFIESAKKEAIDTILEMADYKSKNCKKLIVTGCLVERYKEELEKALPEVDLFIPIKEYDKIFDKLDYMNRAITTGQNYAYLRIADGCSNYCTYCAIPYIRGPLKSRTLEDVLEEAKRLSKEGYKEIILVAQDTARYGMDIYGESKLVELLKELCKLDFKWIRFLYAYPEMITNELIDVVANNEKICNYFDIPIQHISDTVLKRMGRKSNGASIREVIKKIRNKIPDVVIRTSLIVGFPGEKESDFDELYSFVKETKFERLGVFKYSKEEGTPAVKLKEQIPEERKEERYDQIMSLQQEVSAENNQKIIGQKLECIIDGLADDGEMYVTRSYRDVPDTDGFVFVNKEREHKVGDFIECIVKEAYEYDLIAEELK